MLLVALTKAILCKSFIDNDINGGVEMHGLPQTSPSRRWLHFFYPLQHLNASNFTSYKIAQWFKHSGSWTPKLIVSASSSCTRCTILISRQAGSSW
jgi:hypothetical protein